MAIRESLKDSENYQLVAGLDEDGEAQELTFDDDKVKVSVGESEIISSIQDMILSMKSYSELIIDELRILNTHLSILTEDVIGEEDVN